MMVLLAKDIQAHYSERRPTSTDIEREANVAVAIINEPTFVGKSSTLLSFLRQRLANILSPSLDTHDPALPVPPQLTFLQGFDTLERLLSPRYYASEAAMWQALHDFFSAQKDDSRVVCARRVSFVGQEEEGQSKTIDRAKEFIASGRITLIDIGEAEQTFSSSEVRNEVMQGNDGWQRLVSTAVANYIRQQKLYCA
jgi:nicotinamide-nucleotide adenylyltransferase